MWEILSFSASVIQIMVFGFLAVISWRDSQSGLSTSLKKQVALLSPTRDDISENTILPTEERISVYLVGRKGRLARGWVRADITGRLRHKEVFFDYRHALKIKGGSLPDGRTIDLLSVDRSKVFFTIEEHQTKKETDQPPIMWHRRGGIHPNWD